MSTSGEFPVSGGENELFTRELTRVANELFAAASLPSAPAPVSPGAVPVPPASGPLPSPIAAPVRGPSALTPGFSGISTAASAPPLPGVLHTPPLAVAPPPRESDLRSGLTQLGEQLALPQLALVQTPSIDAEPYFLSHAGMPAATPGAPASTLASSPSVPQVNAPAASPVPAAIPVTPVPNATLPSATVPGATLPGLAPPSVSAPATPAPIVVTDFRPEIVPTVRAEPHRALDPQAVKRDFPILRERVHGKPLVWLDNAATTQKPQAVIDRLSYFYAHENSNIHRAAHTLAARATDAYEAARATVQRFLNADSPQQIVFVRGATEAINLVAKSWGARFVQANDEIVISWLEHHANIVPWQQLAAEKGAILRVAPVDERGQVILEEYEKLLNSRTRVVSITQVSNALGTITPAREMTAMAHRHGAKVLIDGAQAVSHMPVDVQALDADFYVFSGHKVFAPTGIGVLYGKSALLESMPPWQGGGNMIADVRFDKTIYQPPPARFEAGTGNIADAAGLGAALDYVSALGLANISRYEHELLEYGTECLLRVPGLRLIGTAQEKAGVLSFVIDGVRTEDIGGALDLEGIAVRAGHHCAQPILRRFGLESTVRASLAPYNTREDLEALTAALLRISERTRGR